MQITKITRSYNRSVNINSLRTPDPTKLKPEDSWVKFTCTYEAEVESTDDAKKVSEHLITLAKEDVAQDIKTLKALVNPSPLVTSVVGANPLAPTNTA